MLQAGPWSGVWSAQAVVEVLCDLRVRVRRWKNGRRLQGDVGREAGLMRAEGFAHLAGQGLLPPPGKMTKPISS